MKTLVRFLLLVLLAPMASAQPLTVPWTGYGRNPQHTALSTVPSQPLNRIVWQAPLDLQPQFWGDNLLIHYGSPVITAANTVFLSVKVGETDGFRIEARSGADGDLRYLLESDYSLPPHGWTPSYSAVLTARNRLYYPGPGGTVYYRDEPDALIGTTGQIAFYGNDSYTAFKDELDATVKISSPITADRYGNIYFGYTVVASNSLGLESGVAKIAFDGTGSAITATEASEDPTARNSPTNCAPALSNDHRTLYFAASSGDFGSGYLVSVDSRNLTPLARVRLIDPSSGSDALVSNDGTASPTIGPDGDVYYGVLGNPFLLNHARGWLLHFDATLSVAKMPGAFGWDDTASIVPASSVPSYSGSSSYLLLTKYNNYAGAGGDGVNRVAVLDPFATMTDPVTGATVMNEVLTIAGPTPDDDFPDTPGAVREWCINTAAVDPFSHSALVNNEDGRLYRWDFNSNTFSEQIVLTAGIGEAYTPTLIGVDGLVYAVNNATLFAVGQ